MYFLRRCHFGALALHSEAPSAILFGSLEFAETLWKVALYNLESIDCFYLTTFRPRFRAICIMVKNPNFVYSDLAILKWPTGFSSHLKTV